MDKCKEFLKHKSKFWFIEKYFPNKMILLEELAKENKEPQLLNELNDIWFKLPDSFNIINMPEGWSEFLSILES